MDSLSFQSKKGELVTTLALLSFITIIFGTVLGTSQGVKSTVTKLFPKAAAPCTFKSTLEIKAVNGTTFTGEQFDYISDIIGGIGPRGSEHSEGTIATSNGSTIANLVANFPLGGDNNFEGKDSSVNIALPAGFRIVRPFCTDLSGSSACARHSTADQNSTIKGITLSCTGNIKYGWEVEKIPASGTTPVPSVTQAPSETTTPQSCNAKWTISVVEKGNFRNPDDSLISTSENGNRGFTLSNELAGTEAIPSSGRFEQMQAASRQLIGLRQNMRITLNDIDDTKWEIDSTYCQNGPGDSVCPSNPNQAGRTMTGFAAEKCGSANLGWVLRDKTVTPTPLPTTPPVGGSSGTGTAEVRLYVLQGKTAPTSSFCTSFKSISDMNNIQFTADKNGKIGNLFITKYLAGRSGQPVVVTATKSGGSKTTFNKNDDGGFGNTARKSLEAGTYSFAIESKNMQANGSQLQPVCGNLTSNISVSDGQTAVVPLMFYMTPQCRTDNSCTSEAKGYVSGSGGRSKICCSAVTQPPVGGNPAPQACSAATCMYSQIDTDNVERCYRGTCRDGTENCSIGEGKTNDNCTFKAECSVPAIELHCRTEAGHTAGAPVAGSRRSGGTLRPSPIVSNSPPTSVSTAVTVYGAIDNVNGCKAGVASKDGIFTGCGMQYKAIYSTPAGDRVELQTYKGSSGAGKNLIVEEYSIPKIHNGNRLKAISALPIGGAIDAKMELGQQNEALLKKSNVIACQYPHQSSVTFSINNPNDAFIQECAYSANAAIPDTLGFNVIGEGSATTPATGDTQLVPVDIRVHKSFHKVPNKGIDVEVWTYPQWTDFPTKPGDKLTVPPNGVEISNLNLSNFVKKGDYYLYSGDIKAPTSGWPTFTFGLNGIFERSPMYLHGANCHSDPRITGKYSGEDWVAGPSDTGYQYANCYNVKNNRRLQLTLSPPGEAASKNDSNSQLTAKYKIDTQTIAKLDRIETQMCDADKNCELVETMGDGIRPTTIVSVKNIKGQALKPDWNYEIFCKFVYTDGTEGTCEGKAISTNNPVASRISSTLFGKTTIVTKTQFESADSNGDGVVNASDVAFFLANFGTARADINLDDSYDTLDLTTAYKWLGLKP